MERKRRKRKTDACGIIEFKENILEVNMSLKNLIELYLTLRSEILIDTKPNLFGKKSVMLYTVKYIGDI